VPDGATQHRMRRHRERYRLQSGEVLSVWCRCRLGRDHGYPDWLQLPENTVRRSRALQVWADGPPVWSSR